jgi:transcriptional regulator with XRE-family HTH domain
MTFAEWLRRSGRGAQRRVAEASGVSVNTVSQIARGRPTRSLDVARALSRATGGEVPVVALLGLVPSDFGGDSSCRSKPRRAPKGAQAA